MEGPARERRAKIDEQIATEANRDAQATLDTLDQLASLNPP